MPNGWCLIKEQVDSFKKALREGTIDPKKLSTMTSAERNKALGEIVGKENAKRVNALFEKQLLLKNQKAGYITWAKKVAGITPEAKRDLISRIEKMDAILNPADEKMFLKDLAETRLGVGVNDKEAKTIFEMTKKIQETKAKANEAGVFPTKDDRLAYGMSQVEFEEYFNDLKLKSGKISFRESPLKYAVDFAGQSQGILKSLLASLDNSFFGRQGIKTLLDLRTSHLWVKNFAKSFLDIGRELGGRDAIRLIKADIYSRPNAVNGKYKAGKYGLDVMSEEAYPSSLPSKIPKLGRLYKASESAYNGAALRMRADLADRYIKIAEKQGLNMSNPDEAKYLGEVIGSLTGRGNLGAAEPFAKKINLLLFSVKFLKANFDTLNAPVRYVIGKTGSITGKGAFKNKGEEFASKVAAQNTLAAIGSVASLLTIAKWLDPTSVDEDPRSGNFGKIKAFGRWVDITGGMAPMVTLAMRLVPTQHNGEWGFWSKNRSGVYVNATSGKYGQDDALDTFENFFEGKVSPALGIVRDVWKGKNYSGDPLTPGSVAKGATVPITVQSFEQMMKDPNSSNVLASIILEGLGFSTSPQRYPTNWNSSTSKELDQFKEKVGQETFKEANDSFNTQYNEWFMSTKESDKYKSLSDEDKQELLTKAKEEIKDQVFKQYKFKYKKPKENKEEKSKTDLKKLLPK